MRNNVTFSEYKHTLWLSNDKTARFEAQCRDGNYTESKSGREFPRLEKMKQRLISLVSEVSSAKEIYA